MATFSAGLKKNYISPSMMISSPSLELHLWMQRADAKSSLTPGDGWLITTRIPLIVPQQLITGVLSLKFVPILLYD